MWSGRRLSVVSTLTRYLKNPCPDRTVSFWPDWDLTMSNLSTTASRWQSGVASLGLDASHSISHTRFGARLVRNALHTCSPQWSRSTIRLKRPSWFPSDGAKSLPLTKSSHRLWVVEAVY